MLVAEYVGTADVLRERGHTDHVVSPNNDHNHGSCPSADGREHGVCVSKTEVTTQVASPFILKNAHASCSGDGCRWIDGCGSGSVVWFDNETTAHATLRNWSVPVTLWLHTGVYKRVGADDCNIEGPVPFLLGQ
jgi:hypothetical protein